jgi:hypothetical protein
MESGEGKPPPDDRNHVLAVLRDLLRGHRLVTLPNDLREGVEMLQVLLREEHVENTKVRIENHLWLHMIRLLIVSKNSVWHCFQRAATRLCLGSSAVPTAAELPGTAAHSIR